MPGAPKGNKNALKHGLYARKVHVLTGEIVENSPPAPGEGLRGPIDAMRYLQEAIDVIFARMKRAEGAEFTQLANALSLAATSLFNGHRTMAFLTGGMTPVEDALKELTALGFEED